MSALSPRQQLVRAVLVLAVVLSTSLVLHLTLISAVQQGAGQHRAFEQLRGQLAEGTAPVGPTDNDGRELAPGSPVAYMEIPKLNLEQVLVEGTGAGTLFIGPGHRRDSPLPGQPGVSVVMGRKAAFGGPFRRIHQLQKGAVIRVTTGEGKYVYKVTGVRRAGDPVPAAPASGEGRLLLVTADGRRFVPSGVLRVDAELSDPAGVGSARLVSSRTLPANEQIMAGDPSTLWALAMWLQFLLLAVLGAAWAWYRWGRAKAWIVFVPPLLLLGISVSGEAARLLPNLL